MQYCRLSTGVTACTGHPLPREMTLISWLPNLAESISPVIREETGKEGTAVSEGGMEGRGGEEASEDTREWKEGAVHGDHWLYTTHHDVFPHLSAAVRPWTTFTRTHAQWHTSHVMIHIVAHNKSLTTWSQLVPFQLKHSQSAAIHTISPPARTHAPSHTQSLTHSEAQPGPQALITKALTGSLRENSLVGCQHLRCFFLSTLPSD